MAVQPNVIADATPQRRWQGTFSSFRDIPQGDIDARDGGGADDARAVPEVLSEHHLPEVFDPSGILTNQQRCEIFQCAVTARVCHSSVASPQPNRPGWSSRL